MDILQPGTFIGPNLKIGEVLDTHGATAIYRCTDILKDTPRVAKVLDPELAQDWSVRDAFRDMARIALRLNHPAIVPMEELVLGGDLVAHTMPLLTGWSLMELLERRGRFTLREALSVVHPVASAMAHAHLRAVAHGEPTPAHVFLTYREGAFPEVRVLDFGIGRFRQALRAKGIEVHTGGYWCLPPEHLQGEPAGDEPTDVFTVAAVLLSLLAGGKPIPGSRPEELAEAWIRGEHRPALEPLDPATRGVVERALSPTPEARPSSKALERAFAEALAGAGGPATSPIPGLERPGLVVDLEPGTPVRDQAEVTRGPARGEPEHREPFDDQAGADPEPATRDTEPEDDFWTRLEARTKAEDQDIWAKVLGDHDQGPSPHGEDEAGGDVYEPSAVPGAGEPGFEISSTPHPEERSEARVSVTSERWEGRIEVRGQAGWDESTGEAGEVRILGDFGLEDQPETDPTPKADAERDTRGSDPLVSERRLLVERLSRALESTKVASMNMEVTEEESEEFLHETRQERSTLGAGCGVAILMMALVFLGFGALMVAIFVGEVWRLSQTDESEIQVEKVHGLPTPKVPEDVQKVMDELKALGIDTDEATPPPPAPWPGGRAPGEARAEGRAAESSSNDPRGLAIGEGRPGGDEGQAVAEPDPRHLELFKQVHRHDVTVRACIAMARRKAPDMEGTLRLAFTVSDSGEPTDISVTMAPDGNGRLERCVKHVVETWRFDPRFAAAKVEVPYLVGEAQAGTD